MPIHIALCHTPSPHPYNSPMGMGPLSALATHFDLSTGHRETGKGGLPRPSPDSRRPFPHRRRPGHHRPHRLLLGRRLGNVQRRVLILLDTRTSAPPTDPIARYQADFASRAEWLALLPYQGITLMMVGVGLLLWRWVAAVRLRMTVSALILPSLRSMENLDRAESGTSASGGSASGGEPNHR